MKNLNLTHLLIVLLLCSCFSNLAAQISPEEKTAKFFLGITSVGYEKALEEFLADDFLMYKDKMPELKDQFKRIFEINGKFNGFESISETAYGESLIEYKYLCKFDNAPMFGSFTYYRPKNRWIVYTFSIKETW